MDPFDLIGRYFHLMIVVAGLFGALLLRNRIRRLVAADPRLADGGRTLLATVVVLVILIPTVQGTLQYLGGGGSDPSWWATRNPSNPYLVADFGFHCAFVLVALWWVWLADGPHRLWKYRAAFAQGDSNWFLSKPQFLKWFITLIGVGFTVMRAVFLFGG